MAVGDRVPKDKRQDLIDVYLHVKSYLPNPPFKHLEYLFEVYNTYIEPHNHQDIGCRTKRANVLNVISTYVRIWKAQEESLSK